jgi:hypothetical protein
LSFIRGYNIENQAKQAGLTYDDNIDLEINEIFDSYNIKTVNFTLIGLTILFLLQFLNSFQAGTISFEIPGLITVSTSIPVWLLTLIFGVLLPFMYSSFLISYGNTGDRNEKMANSIINKCDERGHNSILILVGDKHVEPISEKLDEEGWEVEEHRSNNILARTERRLGFG